MPGKLHRDPETNFRIETKNIAFLGYTSDVDMDLPGREMYTVSIAFFNKQDP